MTVLTVKVEDEINQWLGIMAQKNKKSKSSYIRDILEMYKEDFEDARIALDGIKNKKHYLCSLLIKKVYRKI